MALLLIALASMVPRFSDKDLSNDGSQDLAIKLNKFSQKAKRSTRRETELSSKQELSGTKTGLRKWPRLSRRRTCRETHKGTRQVHCIRSF